MHLHPLVIILVVIVCLLSPDEILPQIKTITVNLEVVTDNALTGDGGNAWGGHQCRIVRTLDGIFTVFTSGGKDHLQRHWHLMKKMVSGWKELASAKSGREPVNLVAGPDGTLYIIGWPDYQGTMWSGKPQGDSIQLKEEKIIAVYSSSHPYNAAGIDQMGNICVVTSVDDYMNNSRFQWAYYDAVKKTWVGRITILNYRHCYTYIFPHPDKSISMVSTRDVRWATLGYEQPPNTFAYVFNAFRYWKTENILEPLEELVFVEEVPTPDFPYVICHALNDAYMDTNDNMHILYTRQGKSTSGLFKVYHEIYTNDGTTIWEAELPVANGRYCRIFQDESERYFILHDSGWLYLLDKNGFSPVDSVKIDLKGYQVEYAGYGLTVPRTGTNLSNKMDIVFPSQGGKYYIYFRMLMDEIFPPSHH